MDNESVPRLCGLGRDDNCPMMWLPVFFVVLSVK